MNKIYLVLIGIMLCISGFTQEPVINDSGQIPLMGIHNPTITSLLKTGIVTNKMKVSRQKSGSSVTTLNFEGMGDNDPINTFYDGGTSGFGNSGADCGITFSADALAIIDSDVPGGTGNFANEPSPSTIMFFINQDPVLNIPAGFITAFSFYYCSSANGEVKIYDGLNGTGELLGTVNFAPNYGTGEGDPTGTFANWTPVGVPFIGIAKSIVFTGVANQCGFDDVTFGSINPGLPTCNDIVVNNDPGVCGALVTYPDCITAALEGNESVVADIPSGSLFPIGTTEVTLTATDVEDNTTIKTFTVTVNDTENPILPTCQNIASNNDNGLCGAVVTWSEITATDNCSATVTTSHASGEVFAVGTTTVTVTAIDPSGNEATCSFDVVVTDTEAPVFTNCSELKSGKAAYLRVTDSEAWGANDYVNSMNKVYGEGNWDDLRFSSVNADELFSNAYSFILINGSANYDGAVKTFVEANSTLMEEWVSDGGSLFLNSAPWNTPTIDFGFGGFQLVYSEPGTSTGSAVSSNDSHPIFIGPNLPVGLAWTGSWFAHAIISPADQPFTSIIKNAATDEDILIEVKRGTGTVFFGGLTAPEWQAPKPQVNNLLDNILEYLKGNGNSEEVIVVENDVNQCGAVVTYSECNTAVTDNCEIASVVADIPSGSYFSVGSTSVTITATDIHGNISTKEFIVTVKDTEKPTIDCPANMTVGTDPGVCSAYIANLGAPLTSDNCQVASITVTPDVTSGYTFEKGETIVTWIVTDIHGNSSQCEQTITVFDDEAPVIEACGKSYIVEMKQVKSGSTTVWRGSLPQAKIKKTISDNCPGNIDIQFSQTLFTPQSWGNNTITVTATDVAGNVSTCTFIVIVRYPLKSGEIGPLADNDEEAGLVQASVNVYPNPTKGKLNIQMSSLNNPNVTAVVYNMAGSVVLRKDFSTEGQFEIDLTGMVNGMYMLRLTADHVETVHKIVLKDR